MNNRGALVSVRCHLWYLNLLRQHLSHANFAHVRSSCFGPLLEIINFEFQGQLYNVMCRRLQSGCVKKMVLQFRIGNHVVEFGPADFAIMTGLRFNGNTNLPESSTFHQTVFSGQRFLHLITIENRFLKECKQTGGSSETSLKLGYLYIVYGLLVLKDRTRKNIDLGYIHLIDNLDRFLCYPWGRIAYDFMVPRTYNARKLLEKMETKENKLTVEAYGFVHVLQAWAYEIMPSLAAFCGKRVVEHENRLPRMQRWSADSGFLFEDLWPYFLPRVGNDMVCCILNIFTFELIYNIYAS
ncbi:uncharacterized protein LOC130993180 [Salvia miltiorrhiza]|uniref:uncharacterized protein LOC130993180 n=1 Tax=Salvia miltiorrhiza TaxID=226208 RepID=UPI0025AD4538|nr:uncharacterized protein LOC130993180 [Salvia miltiorrhiza]